MNSPCNRCRSAACCTLWFTAIGLLAGPASPSAGDVVDFEVREEAGIRRFSFPVHFLLTLETPAEPSANFRLLSKGQPLVAQFQPDTTRDPHRHFWLDFNVSLLPYQAQQFRIEYGSQVKTGPQAKRGHQLEEQASAFKISNAPYISWVVPRDLRGLLSSVAFPPNEHLQDNSAGLVLVDHDGTPHPINSDACRVRSEIVSQGLLGVALRFTVDKHQTGLPGVSSTVDLYFPVSKSWVEVDWQIQDPEGCLSASAVQLDLNLDPPSAREPTLVDFGATSLVYAALRAGQQAELRAGQQADLRAGAAQTLGTEREPSWQALRGAKRLEPFVTGPRRQVAQTPAEGWAHVMDQRRCLALAVHEFSRHGLDRIHTTAEGRVRVERQISAPASRRLRLWLHFVHFPPHISAATSPQAMQNPLNVRLSD